MAVITFNRVESPKRTELDDQRIRAEIDHIVAKIALLEAETELVRREATLRQEEFNTAIVQEQRIQGNI